MKCTPKVESEMDIGRKQAFREYTAFKGVQGWLSRKVASLSPSWMVNARLGDDVDRYSVITSDLLPVSRRTAKNSGDCQ
jgi:hypothetical protein